LKLPASISIIGKPDVQEVFELRLQLADHGENSKAIENHCQRVSLGDSFFAAEETTGAGTVVTAVESEAMAHK